MRWAPQLLVHFRKHPNQSWKDRCLVRQVDPLYSSIDFIEVIRAHGRINPGLCSDNDYTAALCQTLKLLLEPTTRIPGPLSVRAADSWLPIIQVMENLILCTPLIDSDLILRDRRSLVFRMRAITAIGLLVTMLREALTVSDDLQPEWGGLKTHWSEEDRSLIIPGVKD